jgi:hypothetical protein
VFLLRSSLIPILLFFLALPSLIVPSNKNRMGPPRAGSPFGAEGVNTAQTDGVPAGKSFRHCEEDFSFVPMDLSGDGKTKPEIEHRDSAVNRVVRHGSILRARANATFATISTFLTFLTIHHVLLAILAHTAQD